MKPRDQHRTMSFMEAVRFTIQIVPHLKRDMELLVERRKNNCKDMDGVGRWGLSIPNPLMPLLEQYKPELFQSDLELKNKAWLKFMKHDDSKIFRVSDSL